MKVKNIMFFGFAAAILMGTAQAADPVFNIASKAYVDQRVNALSGEGGAVANVVADVNEINDKIAGENEALGESFSSETIVGALNELAGDIADETQARENADAAINDKIGGNYNSTNTVAKAIADEATARNNADVGLQTQLGNGFDNQNTVTKAVADLNTAINNLGGGASGTVAEQIASALHGTNETLDDHFESGTTVYGALNSLEGRMDTAETNISNLQTAVSGLTGNGANSVDGKIDAALGELGSHTDAQTGQSVPNTVADVLATKADAEDVYTKAQTYTKQEIGTLLNAKIDKPAGNECTGASQHCVLTMDDEGNLTWVDITYPYEG